MSPLRPLHALAGAFLLAAALLASGCSQSFTGTEITSDAAAVKLTGNWQLSSTSPYAGNLPALSGAISGTSEHATGLFHSDSSKACASPSVIAELSGTSNASGLLSLTGPYAGGTLSITGKPSADGKSLTGASYTVSGGACGFLTAAAAPASFNAVATVSGTYTGTFNDVYGNQIYVSTVLSQTAPDANGNFVLSGYSNLPANGCFNSPTAVDTAQVTGQQFNVTYTDPNTGNSLVTSGTVSLDAQTLTVGSWTIAGPCAGENGTGGLLTKQ